MRLILNVNEFNYIFTELLYKFKAMKKFFLLFFIGTILFPLQSRGDGITYSFNCIQQHSVSTTVSGNKTVTSFVVDVTNTYNYILAFWLMGVKHSDGTYSSYDLRVDNGNVICQVATDRGDWYMYYTSFVYLTAGTHTISLEGMLDDVPNTRNIGGVPYPLFSSFDSHVNFLLQGYQTMKSNHSNSPYSANNPYRKFDCFPYENNPSSPPLYYTAELNKNLYYTFYRKEYYTAGQTVSFETDVIDNEDHILNVFDPDNLDNASWSATSANGHATLNITFPQTGFYYVMVRTDSNSSWGTCNLTIDSDRIFEDVPVSCSRTEIVLPSNYGSNFSCFAKSSDGDPTIMLMEDDCVVAYNNDFPYNSTLSDYDWGKNARIDGLLSDDQWVLTTIPEFPFTIKADVYTGCQVGGNWSEIFPNLKSNDILYSAQADTTYNCISWAVGEWTVGFWLSHYSHGTPGSTKFKEAVDSIFDAYGYVEISNEANSIIDLWRIESSDGYDYECSHASVRSKGHHYAAGYDWESKIGKNVRLFHPRNALESDAYGERFAYYARSSNWVFPSLDSLFYRPLILNISLTQQEMGRIDRGVSEIGIDCRRSFEEMYQQCQKNGAIKVSVSIDTYEMIKPYGELLKLCQKSTELRYLLYQKICNREILAIKLLEDMTAATDRVLLDEVFAQVEKERRTMAEKSGEKVLSTIQTNAMLLVKELLNREKPNQLISNMVDGCSTLSNEPMMKTSVNGRQIVVGFDLSTDAYVSVMIGSLDGSMISNIVANQKLVKGRQQLAFTVPQPGIYSIALVVNGCVYKQKVTIK